MARHFSLKVGKIFSWYFVYIPENQNRTAETTQELDDPAGSVLFETDDYFEFIINDIYLHYSWLSP